MRVLFIGGTGNISAACVERSLAKGHEVTILHRGERRADFSGPVSEILGDRHDPRILEEAAARHFDVVANFVGFTPEDVDKDLQAFAGQVAQYVFVSTASTYQKPPSSYLVTESTPLRNPYWEYSRNKIACEERLIAEHRRSGFPVTIVRPSYTYGPTWIPSGVGGHGYTILGRMRRGLPIISHGDGQSLWVMTAAADFAIGFVGLFGQVSAFGQAFHITSDEVLTWDQIYQTIAWAAGCEAHLVHVPSEFIAGMQPAWGPGLLGDKAYGVVFDNSKIKRAVPEFRATTTFAQGIAESIAWHDADPSRQTINQETDAAMERIMAAYAELMQRARTWPDQGSSLV